MSALSLCVLLLAHVLASVSADYASLIDVQANNNVCTSFDSSMGATFDLADLVRSPPEFPYMILEGDDPCTERFEPNYTYVFNICGTIPSGLPPRCQKNTLISGSAVVQINRNGTETEDDDECYSLGSYNRNQINLLDSMDPSRGIKLTYFGGATCRDGPVRSTTIEMPCENHLNPVPLSARESNCTYTISMPSVYGCPLECPVSERSICGGKGHCSYDYDISRARCFCNKGYTGEDCSKKTVSSSSLLTPDAQTSSPTITGMIITLFIIVGLLGGAIAYMMRQMQAYKEDVSNYQLLKGNMADSDSAVV